MPTWRIPLPPNSNHGYRVGWQGRLYKTAEVKAWQAGVALIVAPWKPAAKTVFRVEIALGMPPADLWKRDCDGCIKWLLDAVIGSRLDHRVVHLTAFKRPGDGWATVTVQEYAKGATP